MRSVTKKSDSNAAQHFFLYLVTFLALSFLVFGFGAVVFQFINKFFPDPLVAAFQGLYDQDAVKFGIASMLVAGPVYFLLTRHLVKLLRQGEIPEDSKVRKWLTYIILFFASATVIGDLIAAGFSFLGGEITIRFVLKAGAILVIALAVFGYYFWDMRKKEMARKIYPLNSLAAWTSIFLVTCVFGAAFLLIDKPSVAREKKIDAQTISDLQNVDNSLRGYYDQTGQLPQSLGELEKTNFAVFLPQDSTVIYQKATENSFNLCAEFKRSNLDEPSIGKGFPDGILGNTWQHAAGRVCFERIAIKADTVPAPFK